MPSDSSGPEGFRIDEADETVHLSSGPVHLTPKAFRLLRCLVDARGRLVTKDALMEAVWPDAHVTESALSVTVLQLRDALGDDARDPRFIQTVHRRGFRWVGPLAASSDTVPANTEEEVAGRDETGALLPAIVVGRSHALGQLLSLLDDAGARRRQVVFVTGEAGIGKTTLVDSFCRAAAGRGVLVARGQCIDTYGEGEPYMPVLEAVAELCRADSSVGAALREFAPSWLLQIPGLAGAAELSDLARTLAGSTRERMIREFARVAEMFTRDRVVAIVLEDLHWTDPATLALMAAIAHGRTPAALMLVATLRPVDAIARRSPVSPLRRELVARHVATEIALGALSAGDVLDYFGARFERHRFPDGMADTLLELTAGNPLFVVTAVDELVERGRLVDREGEWTCTVTPNELADEVPDGVRAAIELQLERAGDEDRGLLEAAAVVGLRFAVQAVAAAAGRDAVGIEEQCESVARRTVLVHEVGTESWPDGSIGAVYAFRHALHRQVILGRIGSARQRAAHLAIAARYDSAYGSRSHEVAGALARHYELGGDAARAIDHRIAAARVAVGRLAHDEAVLHLRRGLELLPEVEAGETRDSRELALRSAMLAPSFATAGAASEEVEEHAQRIGELTAAAGPRVETFMAFGAMFGVTASRARLRDAEAIARRSLGMSSKVEWAQLHALAGRGQIGLCMLLGGRFAEACPHLDAAASLPDLVPLAPIELSIAHAGDAAVARWILGDAAAARHAMTESVARAEASRHPPTMAYAFANLLRFGLMLSDRSVVERAATAVRRVAEDSGVERWRGLALVGEGWLASFGDAAAHGSVAEGIALLEAFGSRVYSPFYQCARAEALLRHERHDEARDVLVEALATARETGERWCEAELRRLAAAAEAASSRRNLSSRVEASLREALALAGEQGGAWWQLRCALDLARLLRAAGRGAEAGEILRPAAVSWPASTAVPEAVAAADLLASAG